MNEALCLEINKRLDSKTRHAFLDMYADCWYYFDQGVFSIIDIKHHGEVLSIIKKLIQDIDPKLDVTAMAFSPSGELIVNFGYIGTKKGE